ncbi:hypothetical protein [Gemella sp.]
MCRRRLDSNLEGRLSRLRYADGVAVITKKRGVLYGIFGLLYEFAIRLSR